MCEIASDSVHRKLTPGKPFDLRSHCFVQYFPSDAAEHFEMCLLLLRKLVSVHLNLYTELCKIC